MNTVHHALVIDRQPYLPPPDEYSLVIKSPRLEIPETDIFSIFPKPKYNLFSELGLLDEVLDYNPKPPFIDIMYTTTTMMHDFKRDRLPSRYSMRTEYWEHRKRLKEEIAQGNLPPMDNGYSFVIDRRPDEILAMERPNLGDSLDHKAYTTYREAQQIPVREYTKYFSQHKVPIADKDHYMWDHDIGHIPSLIAMFRDKAFADLVQAAALNALPTPEDCSRFARAMDGFGDNMRNLMDDGYVSSVYGASRNLSRLIHLAHPNPNDDPDIEANNRTLFDQIWHSQGLSMYEQEARQIRSNQGSRFEKMEFEPETDAQGADSLVKISA